MLFRTNPLNNPLDEKAKAKNLKTLQRLCGRFELQVIPKF